MKKRLVSVVCISLILVFNSVPAFAAGAFSDVPASHTFYSGIMDCASKGITSGYEDGTFRPSNPVTRAQFCVMLSRAFWPDDIKLYDNDKNKAIGWFVPNSKTLYNRNVLTNTSFREYYDNKYVMDVPITRYDMAQIMTNIMTAMGFSADDGQKASAQSTITDYNKIPDQYKNAVKNVFALGIITGYADGSFSGDKTMNRGQGCVVIYRMLQYDNYTPPTNPVNPDPSNPSSSETPVTPEPTPVTPEPTPSTGGSSDGTLANGKPATEENVLAIIDELLQKYPDGTHWDDNTYRPGTASKAMLTVEAEQRCANGLLSSVQFACGGFASLVSDTIFGSGDKNPARKVPVSQTRPGDVIIHRDKNGYHDHYATAASSPIWFDQATWYPETNTYEGMYYVTQYHGNVNGKASYDEYSYLPETYSESCGYYVEVWTRYPN